MKILFMTTPFRKAFFFGDDYIVVFVVFLRMQTFIGVCVCNVATIMLFN